MVIRKANENDINSNLINLYRELFKYNADNLKNIFKEKTVEEANEQMLKIIKEQNILVIEEKNEIIGFVYYGIRTRETNNEMIIEQIAIDDRYKRKGYATKLMEEIKIISIQNNCTKIALGCYAFNESAIKFYKHLGFKEQKIILEIEL